LNLTGPELHAWNSWTTSGVYQQADVVAAHVVGVGKGPASHAASNSNHFGWHGSRCRRSGHRAVTAVQSVIAQIEAAVPALRRYAGALLRDRQDVDDLVHDCLVLALDRLHTRRGDAGMRAWLFAILHNLYVSRLRRKRARKDAALDVLNDDALAVQSRQESHLQVSDVMLAVQRLPVDFRTVLLLVAVEEFSYTEVAQVLDIPIGTVMSRLARARESVRRDCGEQ
jgi:RNA polymerase sigma-70 factor (ECF subfamily)